MKKIFYSMMAVALCACSQSDVDENMVTPPQPENNALKFEVVDNGFDGTRVSYGDYGDAAAYQATFEKGDAIGIFAIDTSVGMESEGTTGDAAAMTPVPAAYKVRNAKLTLTDSGWELTDAEGNANVDFGTADLLFAYAPYDPNKTIPDAGDKRPSFIQNTTDGPWAIYKKNSRFFTHDYGKTNFSTKELFDQSDWMGDAANITSETKTVTFNMIHMRGMIEVTTSKYVDLTELKLGYTNNAFSPYLFATTKTQKVYRILTTEYRGGFDVKATIQYGDDVKKYKDHVDAKDPGWCSRFNINYTPEGLFTVGEGQSLADALAAKYGENYASNTALSALILVGTLTEADWTTLQGLQNLKTLNMSDLSNKSIPASWMANATTLRTTLNTLVLPSGLTTIEANALQFDGNKAITIELPTTVETIGDEAFANSYAMKVQIPKGSQLKTIGASAFAGLITVYNDPSSFSTLVIPASVTSISASAFNNMSGLRHVTFQTDKAPATEKTNIFGNTAINIIYVPNSPNYKDKGFFPGKTVIVPSSKIDLAESNFSSLYTHPTDGIGLAGLCDGILGVPWTHWHSQYSGNYGEWGIYIDITLPGQQYNDLWVSYTTRADNANGAPTIVRIGVSSDGETFTKAGEDFEASKLAIPEGNPGGNHTVAFGTIPVGANKYVRFAILEANRQSVVGETSQAANMAELSLYTEGWTEPNPDSAQ